MDGTACESQIETQQKKPRKNNTPPHIRRRRWLVRQWEIEPRCDYCNRATVDPREEAEDRREGGRPVNLRDATFDHIVPRCRGGIGIKNNRALACRRCNALKADSDPADWPLMRRRTKEGERR